MQWIARIETRRGIGPFALEVRDIDNLLYGGAWTDRPERYPPIQPALIAAGVDHDDQHSYFCGLDGGDGEQPDPVLLTLALDHWFGCDLRGQQLDDMGQGHDVGPIAPLLHRALVSHRLAITLLRIDRDAGRGACIHCGEGQVAYLPDRAQVVGRMPLPAW